MASALLTLRVELGAGAPGGQRPAVHAEIEAGHEVRVVRHEIEDREGLVPRPPQPAQRDLVEAPLPLFLQPPHPLARCASSMASRPDFSWRGSPLRARKGSMGDLQESSLAFGENRTPDVRRSVRWDPELLNEQADHCLKGDPLGREVDSFKRKVTWEALLCQRPANLKMHRGVRRRRFSKIVIPEYPVVSLSVELILKARRLDLCAPAFSAILEKQDHHEPQIAPIGEGKGIVRSVPSSEHRLVTPWPIREANPSARREDGLLKEQRGEVAEGLEGFGATGSVALGEAAHLAQQSREIRSRQARAQRAPTPGRRCSCLPAVRRALAPGRDGY